MGRLDVSFTPNASAPEARQAAIRKVVLRGTLKRAFSEEPAQVLLLQEVLDEVVREAQPDEEGED